MKNRSFLVTEGPRSLREWFLFGFVTFSFSFLMCVLEELERERQIWKVILLAIATWCLSNKDRNRLAHALNGNTHTVMF